MISKDWGDYQKAKILVIGHDPRLQRSDTIAEYCFFADYYFREVPTKGREKSKFNLAKSSIDQILYLTSNKFNAEEIFLTNLCNEELPHAPKGKTVLISDEKAKSGLVHILEILSKSNIEYVFPTSLQVNYLLQKLNFYNSNNDFLEKTKLREKGINNDPPYFEVSRSKTFQMICGNIYQSECGKYKIIPILHPKHYPLKRNFLSYQVSYNKIKDYFENINRPCK